ncbi:MAG: integrase domain-containing protein [Gammaproteobacteria bacterium]|nr:integrase domain-containing protein [Gammaproteobacteria bacterium]
MAKSGDHKTKYQIRALMKRNTEGSPNRQTSRLHHIEGFIDRLQARGYGQRWDYHNLGAREVNRVVSDWRADGLEHRTIANYMASIRWWAKQVGRADVIPSNRQLGIPSRGKTPGWGEDKAEHLPPDPSAGLGEREMLVTLLRAQFGLRTEEACKFSHAWATADGPDRIRLRGSWCKGGRPREIRITTPEQHALLARIGEFQRGRGERSMIPKGMRFVTYYRNYNRARKAAGIPGHGLRHAFAQGRFEQEAGMPSPHAGGPAYSSLDAAGREQWDRAAAVVNRELGHGDGRQDITATYIGPRN